MHDHDHGLVHDLETLLQKESSRRQSLRWLLAGAAGLPMIGCGGGGSSSSAASPVVAATSTTNTTTTTSTSGSCAAIPEETNGPYPADGTNTNASGVANALLLSGIVRSDIRSSIAGANATASGIPLTVKIQLVNVGASCASLANAAVYIWHCDKDGNYSMYSSSVANENYLRGVQVADANGMVTFTTIVPGCYAGRMPHIHFEVFASLAKATTANNRLKTSQMAFPTVTMNEVYATTAYASSARNLANMNFASDNVFSDGTSLQMASMTGSVSAGYTASLVVGVTA